jgi:hypothetical protein
MANDDPDYHEEEVEVSQTGDGFLYCVHCGRTVKIVPDNEGPESLKSMFPGF